MKKLKSMQNSFRSFILGEYMLKTLSDELTELEKRFEKTSKQLIVFSKYCFIVCTSEKLWHNNHHSDIFSLKKGLTNFNITLKIKGVNQLDPTDIELEQLMGTNDLLSAEFAQITPFK